MKGRILYLVESCSNVLIEIREIYFMKHLFRELSEANNCEKDEQKLSGNSASCMHEFYCVEKEILRSVLI